MEPTDALRSIETALRLVIREILGNSGWLSASGAPDKEGLEARRTEEEKRRDGARPSSDLLDYTETYHLTAIIKRNWERFQPVFRDKGRTQTYLGVVEDVRNAVAHSRELVPYERDLISGIAGHIRNLVSLYRSTRIQSSNYYPLIESIRDNLGMEGLPESHVSLAGLGVPSVRLEVGDVLIFTGTAFNARGKAVKWRLIPLRQRGFPFPTIDMAEGDSVTFDYTVEESDVGENFAVRIEITSESKYHRHDSHDDAHIFAYSVNPPEGA